MNTQIKGRKAPAVPAGTRLALAVGAGFVYTGAFALFRDDVAGFTQMFLRFATVAVLWWFGMDAALLSWRRLLPHGAFGLMAAFFVVAARTVYTYGGPPNPWQAWLAAPLLLFALVYTVCAHGLSALLCRFSAVLPTSAAASPRWLTDKKAWLMAAAAIFALWLPSILSFGPVIISPDSRYVMEQALGATGFTDVHPIAYTLVVTLFLNFGRMVGNVMVGAWLFGLAQSLFMAGVLGYALYWLQRQGCPPVLLAAGLAWFTLTPSMAVLSISMWKDVPFNACLMLLVLWMYNVAQTDGDWLMRGKNAVKFIVLCVTICFLRANGYQVVLVCLGLLLVVYHRHFRRFALLFLPLLVAVPLVRGPLYTAIGLEDLGRVELAAVPIQQVAWALNTGAVLSAEDETLLNSIMPIETLKSVYTSASVDPIKSHPQFNREAFNANFGGFIRMWLRLLPQNKNAYLTAWLWETLGYWKPGFAAATMYYTPEVNDYMGVHTQDVIAEVFGVSLQRPLQRNASLISLGTLAHVMLFAAAHLVAGRRWRYALCLVPIGVLWGGLLLVAPVYAEYRYMLVAALALPAVVFMLVQPPGGPAVEK